MIKIHRYITRAAVTSQTGANLTKYCLRRKKTKPVNYVSKCVIIIEKIEKNYHVNRFKMKFDVSCLTQEQRVHIKSPDTGQQLRRISSNTHSK